MNYIIDSEGLSKAISEVIEQIDIAKFIQQLGFVGTQRTLLRFPFEFGFDVLTVSGTFRSDDYVFSNIESHILLYCDFNIIMTEATTGSQESFTQYLGTIRTDLDNMAFKITHENIDIIEPVRKSSGNYQENTVRSLITAPSIMGIEYSTAIPPHSQVGFAAACKCLIARKVGPGGLLRVGAKTIGSVTHTYRISGVVYSLKEKG